MNENRLDLNIGLIVLGAALLLVGLFLDWYEPGLSAWTVFELIDLALAALAVVVIIGVLSPHLGERSTAWIPKPSDRALFLFGLAAFAIVLSQLINHPPAAVDRGPLIGAWLSLAGSVLMLAGGIMAAAAVSVAINLGRRDELLAARRPPEPTERREPGDG